MFLQARKPYGIPQEEVEDKAREKDVWATLINLLPTHPIPNLDKQGKKDGWF